MHVINGIVVNNTKQIFQNHKQSCPTNKPEIQNLKECGNRTVGTTPITPTNTMIKSLRLLVWSTRACTHIHKCTQWIIYSKRQVRPLHSLISQTEKGLTGSDTERRKQQRKQIEEPMLVGPTTLKVLKKGCHQLSR